MKRKVCVTTALATAAALGGGFTAQAPAGAADSSGRCPAGSSGVTVVVDYGPLGGGVEIGCDEDGSGPASAVVPRAGFPLSWVTNEPGFVCAVKGKPDPDSSCQGTPRASWYWGLFWSDGRPATWAYASEGARTLDVPAGGSIGWRFQNGDELEQPGAAPTTTKPKPKPAPAPKPSSAPTPSPSSRPSPSARPEQVTPTVLGSASSAPRTSGAEPVTAGAGRPSSAPRQRAKDEPKRQGKRTGEGRRGRDERSSRESRESVSTSAGEVYEVEEPLSEPVAPASVSDGRGTPPATVAALVLLAALGSVALLVARRRAPR